MPSVSKSAFLKPLRRKSERYPLPEYGEDAYVVIQALTSQDVVALQQAHGSNPDSGNTSFVNELFYRCLADDNGSPIFDSAADAGAGMNLSLPAMESLVEACLRVSGVNHRREEGKN